MEKQPTFGLVILLVVLGLLFGGAMRPPMTIIQIFGAWFIMAAMFLPFCMSHATYERYRSQARSFWIPIVMVFGGSLLILFGA